MFLEDTVLARAFSFHLQVFFPISEFFALTRTPSPFLSKPVELSALAPSFVPSLTIFCVLFCFLVRFVLCVLLFRGKICLVTLSYLAKNDCPLGSLTRCDITHLLNTTFCLGILLTISPSNPSTTNCFS